MLSLKFKTHCKAALQQVYIVIHAHKQGEHVSFNKSEEPGPIPVTNVTVSVRIYNLKFTVSKAADLFLRHFKLQFTGKPTDSNNMFPW